MEGVTSALEASVDMQSKGDLNKEKLNKLPTASSERIQTYVDETLSPKSRLKPISTKKSSGNEAKSLNQPSLPDTLVVEKEEEDSPTLQTIDYDVTTWPLVRDRLPRPVVPLFSFRSSSSSMPPYSPYGPITYVDTVFVVPTTNILPEDYGRMIKTTMQVLDSQWTK